MKPFIRKITLEVLENRLPQGVIKRQFPKINKGQHQRNQNMSSSKSTLDRKFDKRQTPQGRDYYWLAGEFVNQDKGEDTDEWALGNGYISVVPVQFDLTAHHAAQELNTWKWNEKADLLKGFYWVFLVLF
jgi:5'-nucleotidase